MKSIKNKIVKFVYLGAIVINAQEPVKPLLESEDLKGWLFNREVSDEFNAKEIDENKWYIVGKLNGEGKPVYKHPDKPNKKVWKGRAPSQFSGRNYRLEDGILKLEARWEPNFPFSPEITKPIFGKSLHYRNITTACFIQRKTFKYGYIEIRSKAIDAQVSSAFWAIGQNVEFDFFEMFGDGKKEGKEHLDQQLWWSIRDWKKLKGKPSYTERKDLGFRVADDFHVYGIDWSEKGIKYYVDGVLFTSITAEEVNSWAIQNRNVSKDYYGYVARNPISIWLDIETFPWNGMPNSKKELTLNGSEKQKKKGYMDFEIDYIRVWKK